jgi:hypothetical protein
MYVSNTARYLGGRSTALMPRALGHAYLGLFGKVVPACQDVSSGFLIDCWNAAEQRGLGYGGQTRLTALSTAYQRLTRPGRLAGWIQKRGGGMRWVNPRRLGQPDISADLIPADVLASGSWGNAPATTTDATGATIPAPAWPVPTDIPPPVSIVNQPLPIPKILANLQPTLPYVTANTLLAAAALPKAPDVVKQAAAQLPASATSGTGSLTSLLTGSAIAGIPNYVWLIFVFGGLVFAGSRRR